MPMREDCRHFQSRTYDTGEVARFCVLNLAPEAPWRCPENCSKYQRDIIDTTFVQGSLVRPQVEAEPDDAPEEIAGVLDEADAIVTAAGPEILAQVEAERAKRPWWKGASGKGSPWKRWRRGGDDGDFNLSDR
ncbi:MAG: hypothetical protein ACYC1D_19495 [Acidimicrobiales bacterium]